MMFSLFLEMILLPKDGLGPQFSIKPLQTLPSAKAVA